MNRDGGWDRRYREILEIYRNSTKNRFLSGSLDIEPQNQILYFGCRNFDSIKLLTDKKADVLVICVDEESLVKLRRDGIGAILMNAEYIPYENRFDKIICEDIFYPIYCPTLVFDKVITSLKKGGEAFLEIVVDGGNVFIKELIWQLLRENGYIYSLYSPKYFKKERLIELIPKDRLENYKIITKYKSELINSKKGFSWLKPYIKMVSSHLTISQQHHFKKLMELTLKKRLDSAINNSLVMEYTVLQLYMKK
jgi:hypothetical protein